VIRSSITRDRAIFVLVVAAVVLLTVGAFQIFVAAGWLTLGGCLFGVAMLLELSGKDEHVDS
jgi:protein-S-isoprenylcysteine O-methyltransferase Ste14